MADKRHTNRKCREIIEAIRDLCNSPDVPDSDGDVVGFREDWGGGSLTLSIAERGHTHVGTPEGTFDDLVDSLHGVLIHNRGLSFALPPEAPDAK